MNESLKILRPCPFCKSDHSDHWTWFGNLDDGRIMLNHFCYGAKEGLRLSIAVYGASLEEVVERWNSDGEVEESESV